MLKELKDTIFIKRPRQTFLSEFLGELFLTVLQVIYFSLLLLSLFCIGWYVFTDIFYKKKGGVDMLISTPASFFVPATYVKDLSENLEDFIEKAEFDSEKMRLVAEKIYDSETKLVVHFMPDGQGSAYIYRRQSSEGDYWDWREKLEFKLEIEEYLKFLEKFLEKAKKRR